MKTKLILPACKIPEDTIVTKATGTYRYTLKRGMSIMMADGRQVQMCEGACLLVPGNAREKIYEVAPTTELAVIFEDLDGLGAFVDQLMQEEEH
jgi:hypothetical protein